MGLDELLITLKKNEQQEIDNIWQTARNEAEKLRLQASEESARITKEHSDRLSDACRKSRRSIFSKNANRVREKKLFAYQALDRALLKAALKQLPALRECRYEKTFALLAAELPERQWEKVFVNPADIKLAAKYFPPVIIHADPAVSGGLAAVAAGGRIMVDNTFEKRLERKWFLLLPAIIAKLDARYEEPNATENIG